VVIVFAVPIPVLIYIYARKFLYICSKCMCMYIK
jgi:hypothetical protein